MLNLKFPSVVPSVRHIAKIHSKRYILCSQKSYWKDVLNGQSLLKRWLDFAISFGVHEAGRISSLLFQMERWAQLIAKKLLNVNPSLTVHELCLNFP